VAQPVSSSRIDQMPQLRHGHGEQQTDSGIDGVDRSINSAKNSRRMACGDRVVLLSCGALESVRKKHRTHKQQRRGQRSCR